MKENNTGFIIFLFFLFMFGGGFSFLFGLLPIFLVGFGAYSLIKALKDRKRDNEARKTVDQYRDSAKNMSNRDRNRIDGRLNTYFQDHINLPIFENVSLTTQSGSYTAVENLFLTIGEEKVLSLEEFRSYDPSIYNAIVNLLLAFAKQNEDVMAAEVKKPEKNEIPAQPKLSNAQQYIDKINALNQDIPNEEITNGLHQTCALLKQIDVSNKEDKESKLTKLYDYYLPILTGILDNYRSLMSTGTQSKEFKDSENELIKTIILINEALKTINESLHEQDYMNLSADITTLQSLLKKDGYTDANPFSGKEE